MRKILLTACALAMSALTVMAEQYIVGNPTTDGVLTAGQVLSKDGEPIKVTANFETVNNRDLSATCEFPDGTVLSTFGGTKIPKMRTKNVSKANPKGESDGNGTSFELVITSKITTLKFYGEASGNTRTFNLMNQETGENLSGTSAVTSAVVSGDHYGYVFTWTNVEPGTYTLWNKSFGGGYCGIIYEAEAGEVDTRDAAPIMWVDADGVEAGDITLKIRDALSTLPTIKNVEGLALKFESSNPEVATVDETGKITYLNPEKVGSTTISASYNADNDATLPYKPTTVKFTITVINNITDAYVYEEYTAPEAFALDVTFSMENKGVIKADQLLIEDANLVAKAVSEADKKESSTTFFGQTFKVFGQVSRVAKAPTPEAPTGEAQAGNTALVLTPATDLQFVMFIRRQTVEQSKSETDYINDPENPRNEIVRTHVMGMTPNDGKSVYVVDQSDVATQLPQELVFSHYNNDNNCAYIYTAVTWNLEAGKTYTVYAYQTTIQMFACGYVLPKEETPAAPQIFIGENEHTDGPIDLNNSTVTLTFKAAEGHNVYYNFTKTVTEPENPAAAPAREAAATLEHNGETYTLVPAEGLTLSENGKLKVIAHNPTTDARSEIVERGVTGGTTAITEIEAAGSGEAVYYNLQGQRVAQPAQGLYIRVENGTAQKVMVK